MGAEQALLCLPRPLLKVVLMLAYRLELLGHSDVFLCGNIASLILKNSSFRSEFEYTMYGKVSEIYVTTVLIYFPTL